MFVLGIIIGLLVGGSLGVIIFSLCAATARVGVFRPTPMPLLGDDWPECTEEKTPDSPSALDEKSERGKYTQLSK